MIAIVGAQMNDESEHVRETAARAFGMVAVALGIPDVLPFLRFACQSKEWPLRVRHTGIKVVEQIAIRMGCGLEPHAKSLVDIIAEGLDHRDLEMFRITALSLAAIADAIATYGHETFKPVFTYIYLFLGSGGGDFYYRCGRVLAMQYDGRVLAALVKLCSSIVPFAKTRTDSASSMF